MQVDVENGVWFIFDRLGSKEDGLSDDVRVRLVFFWAVTVSDSNGQSSNPYVRRLDQGSLFFAGGMLLMETKGNARKGRPVSPWQDIGNGRKRTSADENCL